MSTDQKPQEIQTQTLLISRKDHGMFELFRALNRLVFFIGLAIGLFMLTQSVPLGLIVMVGTFFSCGFVAALGCIYDRLGLLVKASGGTLPEE